MVRDKVLAGPLAREPSPPPAEAGSSKATGVKLGCSRLPKGAGARLPEWGEAGTEWSGCIQETGGLELRIKGSGTPGVPPPLHGNPAWKFQHLS